MKNFTINNDTIPAIGLGTWQMPDDVIPKAIDVAIDCGYRHFDCAAIYLNEKAIGQSLQKTCKQKQIDRNQLWITSKLWNSFHQPAEVEKALLQTLQDLQLDYLDLYLMHWPINFKLKVGLALPEQAEDYIPLEQLPLIDTWHAMEELVDKGLVRHIGVSNFGLQRLKNLVKQARITPSVNQVECHPYLAQPNLVNECRQLGVHITAYAPLGSSDRPERLKKDDDPSISLLDHPTIIDIAKSLNATEAQVLLAWQLQRGVSSIPKSNNPSRIIENFKAQELQLDDNHKRAIDQLDKNYRYFGGDIWPHMAKDSPYRSKFWD